uniref:Solute carrier family 22 member 13-like n=1 Tax=Lepisosteus oculatus TaxID=7918 RepID=W5NL01_LEPOC
SEERRICVFRVMGPLQKSVYWRLSLIFVFTAFMFFVDVFTVHHFSCASLRESGNVNFLDESPEKNFSYDISNENRSLSIAFAESFNVSTNKRGTENKNKHVMSSECGDNKLREYGLTMYMSGLLLGSLFGGALSDKYGKKVLLVGCSTIQAIIALMPAFIPNAIFHLTARLIGGIMCCGINIASFSLGVEWSLPRYHVWPPALLSFSFSIGMMFLALIAYLASNWQQFYLAIAVPQLLCIPLYFCIPESPRWLLMKKRFSTLEEYRHESRKDQENLDLILETVGMKTQQPIEQNNASERISDFQHFKSQTIVQRLCIMSFISLSSALTYYGICFNVGNFGVNIYLAQFFSGLTEMPTLLVPLLLVRFGRRTFTMISLLMSGSGCLLSLLVSKLCDMPSLVMALALIGKLCMQTTVFVSLLYGIELFPTVIRQKCVGFVNLWYRIGCILNAVLSPKDGISLEAMICYGSGPILGAGLCLLLPETSGISLPDTVQDCKKQPVPSLFSKSRKVHVPGKDCSGLEPIQELQ